MISQSYGMMKKVCSDTLTRRELEAIIMDDHNDPRWKELSSDGYVLLDCSITTDRMFPCYVTMFKLIARGQGIFKVLTCSDCK